MFEINSKNLRVGPGIIYEMIVFQLNLSNNSTCLQFGVLCAKTYAKFKYKYKLSVLKTSDFALSKSTKIFKCFENCYKHPALVGEHNYRQSHM